jgi:bifunctional UDP-N-acetylglucosamine pyrophosphorylase / glucosamine-1-phosphate N-acetyltransferase
MNAKVDLEVDIIIMAAGKGTRMKSKLPKVLHKLAGRALLQHVVDTAAVLAPRSMVAITGHGATEVIAACAAFPWARGQNSLHFVLQEPQLGTGHAVQQAVPVLQDGGITLVLSGDVPLMQADTLHALVQACAGTQIALLTIDLADPTGYGRIVRQGTQVQAIVEHKDASAAQRAIGEIYSGIMAAPTHLLKKYLALLDNHNAQKEFYLTDVVKHAVAAGTPVVAVKTLDAVQVAGVNSPVQLQELEREFQKRNAHQLMEQGVRLADAARIDVRGSLGCGQDVSIDVNCVFEGTVLLADGVQIGAHCHIAHCSIAAGAVIHPFTHIDGGDALGVQVGAGALVGPFARLRPGAQLGEGVHIGNFVEVKNSTLAAGAKANHLAYLGDATVGERVNYGAGSITANYDGANKHRTVIEADVHIGSNCVLVAPVTIGAGGTVGGGSTITKSTPAGALSVARGKQVSLAGWSRPVKLKK